MKINEAVEKWINRKDKQRKRGRYWASDIYKIKKGYLTPDNFYKKNPVQGEGIGLVSQGIAAEDYITRVLTDMKLDVAPQMPFEIAVSKGIVLSGISDYKFKDKVVEAKCPKWPLDCIPSRYEDQLECYYRAFLLPVYLLEINFNPFTLILRPYEPSEERWEETKKILKKFHKSLDA